MFNLFSSTSSGGISALGINGQQFLIQLITFLIVFLILKKWAFKPILGLLQRRRDVIEKGVKLEQEMSQKNAELEEKIASELHKARLDADKVINDAQVNAHQIIQEATSEAKKKSELVLQEAEERIKQDTIKARNRLEKDLIGLISETTEAIIDEKVDATKDAALIEKSLKRTKVEV